MRSAAWLSRVLLRLGLVGLAAAALSVSAASALDLARELGVRGLAPDVLRASAQVVRLGGGVLLVFGGLLVCGHPWVAPLEEAGLRTGRRSITLFAAVALAALLSEAAEAASLRAAGVTLVPVLLGALLIHLSWARPLARTCGVSGAMLLLAYPLVQAIARHVAHLQAPGWTLQAYTLAPDAVLLAAGLLAATSLAFVAAPRPGTGHLK